MSYSTLVIPSHIEFLPYTEELIERFRAQGGRVITAAEAEINPVCEKNRLSYTMRRFPDFDMHYFVNSNAYEIEAQINVGDMLLSAESGELSPFSGRHKFDPYESIVVFDTHAERTLCAEKPATTPLSLSGEWSVKSASYNSLTLDTCD